MKDQNPVLELLELSRTFAQGSVRAVDRVSLQVYPGEIVSLLGPSGCGKTTTMRMIAGLDDPSAGDIRLRGRSLIGVPPHRRNIGLVFQSLAAFPHMTVRENVAFGLRMQRMARPLIAEKVDRILDLVQLPPSDFAGRTPKELSGGQLQRVALARTLVTEPAVVLFDEPMAALDRRLRDYMAVEMRAIQKRLGFAAIYVTHDQETASAMSDRLAIMRAGKIVQVGPPSDVYHAPDSRFVADFLGDANFLVPQDVQRVDADRAAVRIFDTVLNLADPGAGDTPSIMLRPEHVSLTSEPVPGAAKGEIVNSQFKGGAYRWQIALADGQQVIAQSPTDVARGEVWLTIRPEHARLLRQ